jgi:protein SCO1/2/putative membrane protein
MHRYSLCWFAAAFLATVLLSGCSRFDSSGADDDYGPVGDFSLTERSEATVQRSDLAGKVWVAAFIFTRCAGPCHQISGTMAHLQQDLKGHEGVVQVSFTVDPEYDQLKVLRAYAERYGADPKRWLFLTGPREPLYSLIINSFHLGVQSNDGPDGKAGYEVEHSTKLVLVDGQGRIRGYYSGTDPADLPRLENAIRRLTWPTILPAVNAALNGLSALLLIAGYLAIRRRWISLHKACMLTALVVSCVFLMSYLYYHLVFKHGEPTRFPGTGMARVVYLSILLSHTVLAAGVAPMALFTAYQALRNQFKRHVRVARWTLPLWLYVSITGVVVYVMLYHLYPPS